MDDRDPTGRHFSSLPALYRGEEADAALRAPGFSAAFVRGEGKIGARLMLARQSGGSDRPAVRRPGRTALRALDGVSLKTDRGLLLSWEGRMLLATIHPSYLLRLHDHRDEAEARFREDLRTAARAAGLMV